jgi:DnaJ-class molecular chaperone
MADDHYKTLGVERGASQDEILKAYRKLARKHHPDLNPNDKTAKERFQKVQSAYDVLKDPEKRKMYDQFGSDYERAGARPGGPGGGFSWRTTSGRGQGAGGSSEFDMNDLFGGSNPFAEFFAQRGGGGPGMGGAPGSMGGQPRYTREESEGVDIQADLPVPFKTAVLGGKVAFHVRRQTGKSETLEVTIKPGVEEGKKIRLRGQGEFGAGGMTPGDLMLVVRIESHKWFTRKGNDLYVRVPVTLGEAVFGGKVDVPTPNGTVALRVPPGTSSGAKLRIKGHGVPVPDGTPGDLFAEVQIRIPAELTAEERAAIEEIEKQHPSNPRQDLSW